MPTLSARESMGTIDKFIQEVGAAEKRAADKQAEQPLSEPGSQGGETSHPVKNVDDRLQAAKEGDRSAENEADVKNDQGKPSVNSTPEASSEGTKKAGFFDLSRFAKPLTKKAEGKSSDGSVNPPGTASDDQLQIGTKKEPTGEDPSVETNSAKAGKEDPGSSHPARTDNDQLDGHKYATDDLESMSLEQLAKMASDMGNDLCEALAAEQPQTKQSTDSRADADLAHQAGWELAGLVTGEFDKKAADALVQDTLEQVIKTASDDADRVAHYLDVYFDEARTKQAEGAMPPDPSAGLPPSPGGGLPMGDAGGGAEPPMGGGEPPMGGGGEDMLSALGGGDPAADPAAGGDLDPQVLELAQVLSQMGVTAQELEQAMAGGAGGDVGGEEVGPGEPDGDEPPAKEAAAKKGNTREGVREVIQEILTRSRRK